MDAHDRKTSVDAALFRRVMGRFATGITVITAESDGVVRGMTANAFMSGSLDPPLCLISVAAKAHMHAHLMAAGRFGVSILALGQESVSAHFAGYSTDRLHIGFERVAKVPLLKDASAVIAADMEARHNCGDHTLFIGRIVYMHDHERIPLVYQEGRYGTFVSNADQTNRPTIEFW